MRMDRLAIAQFGTPTGFVAAFGFIAQWLVEDAVNPDASFSQSFQQLSGA